MDQFRDVSHKYDLQNFWEKVHVWVVIKTNKRKKDTKVEKQNEISLLLQGQGKQTNINLLVMQHI